MRNGMNSKLLHNGKNGLYINLGGGKQRFTQCFPKLRHIGLNIFFADVENFPYQAEAIGMNTGGGQAD